MENCVAPGLDEFDVLLEVVLSLVRVWFCIFWAELQQMHILEINLDLYYRWRNTYTYWKQTLRTR